MCVCGYVYISIPPPIFSCFLLSLQHSGGRGADVRQGDVPNLDILVAPFVEELRLANLLRDVLWQGGVLLRRLDFDLAVRHVGRLDWAVLLLPATGELVDVEGGESLGVDRMCRWSWNCCCASEVPLSRRGCERQAQFWRCGTAIADSRDSSDAHHGLQQGPDLLSPARAFSSARPWELVLPYLSRCPSLCTSPPTLLPPHCVSTTTTTTLDSAHSPPSLACISSVP